MKAAGVGAAGARIPRAVWVAAVTGQVAALAMGLAPTWPLALAATAVAGFCATWCGVSLQAAIQTGLPDGLRGRVMSLWVVVGFGTVAIGSLTIGAIADLWDIGTALTLAGACGIVGMIGVLLGVRFRENPPM